MFLQALVPFYCQKTKTQMVILDQFLYAAYLGKENKFAENIDRIITSENPVLF